MINWMIKLFQSNWNNIIWVQRNGVEWTFSPQIPTSRECLAINFASAVAEAISNVSIVETKEEFVIFIGSNYYIRSVKAAILFKIFYIISIGLK